MTSRERTRAHGLATLRCTSRPDVLGVLSADYRYLLQNPAFVRGRLFVSADDPDQYLHMTDWKTEAALISARADDEVTRIFARLPPDSMVSSVTLLPLLPLLTAADGRVSSHADAGV